MFIELGRNVRSLFLGVSVFGVSLCVFRVVCRCLTVVNLFSFSIAHSARFVVVVNAAESLAHSSWSDRFIPVISHSPSVNSSRFASVAIRRNSFQYSVIDLVPCSVSRSLMRASPCGSTAPNCCFNSVLNSSQVFHPGWTSSSA